MILKQLNTLSYACTDQKLLEEIEGKLLTVKSQFEEPLRRTEGLLLLPNRRMNQYKLARNSVKKARKLLDGTPRFCSLSVLKRKKKKGLRRYGQKADRLRIEREQQNEKQVICGILYCIVTNLNSVGEAKGIIKKRYFITCTFFN